MCDTWPSFLIAAHTSRPEKSPKVHVEDQQRGRRLPGFFSAPLFPGWLRGNDEPVFPSSAFLTKCRSILSSSATRTSCFIKRLLA